MASPTLEPTNRDSLATMAAIGVLAFVATDIAHEVVGHGIGLFIGGGRTFILTTTRLIYATQLPEPFWRIFDLAGPMGNLSWAALCLILQRLVPHAASRLRLFLWAGAMFSLFWEFGYLMKCGVSGHGDAMALIEGLKPAGLWRALLFLAGLALYGGAIRLLGAELHSVIPAEGTEWRPRLRRVLWTLYLAGGVTACAGAVPDPRGAWEILNSGVASSFFACVGLGFIARSFALHPDKNVDATQPVRGNLVLAGCAAVVFLLFAFVLGPGIHVSL